MLNSINNYKKWNNGLFNYFFPTGNENPILFLNDTILEKVGIERNICNHRNNWGKTFLSDIFVSNDRFNNRVKCNDNALSMIITGSNLKKIRNATSWIQLLRDLNNRQFCGDKTPAFFSIICAITYIAGIRGANHEIISQEVNSYLYPKADLNQNNASIGTLFNTLLQSLHKFVGSFNPDRMICGEQINMSRLKYHVVLRREVRDDFISFLEINNLEWKEYESYNFFINNILVPALTNAGKTNLIDFVINSNYIQYVQNILQSNLNYGRACADITNQVQERIIKWSYTIEFDSIGEVSYSIISDYVDIPFNIYYEENEFKIDENASFKEVINRNVKFTELADKIVKHDGTQYRISNISQNWDIVYFERIADDYYRQVEEPINGKGYIILIKNPEKNDKLKRISNKQNLRRADEYIKIDNYSAYEIDKIEISKRNTNNHPNRQIENEFNFHRVGTWCSINLKDNQKIYWCPGILNGEDKEISPILKGVDGKTYFRLPTALNNLHLIGNLKVKQNSTIKNSIQVSHEIQWDGSKQRYYLNGWGEAITEKPNYSESKIRRKQIIQRDNIESNGSDILLQILFDLADCNGCVTQRKMRAALDFTYSFHGIITTDEKRNSIINALKSLGYMISYYDVHQHEYVNQLQPRYIEMTNYSGNTKSNLFLVKGVYSVESLKELLRINKDDIVKRLRPYNSEQRRQEYICLPDTILVSKSNNWPTINYQISDSFISIMESMSGFKDKFLTTGDTYMGEAPTITPFVVNKRHVYGVCTGSIERGYTIYRYYNDNEYNRPIPKTLSKLYTQNERELPVCIFGWDAINKRPDYSRISFLEGMGVPRLLNTALCDSNLGLPKIKQLFITYQDEKLGISNPKTPIHTVCTYDTNATSDNFSILRETIQKLSGNPKAEINESCSSVFIYKKNDYYKVKYIKQYENKKGLFGLFYGKELIAFAIDRRLYYKKNNSYIELKTDNINKSFSDIIKDNYYNDTHEQKVVKDTFVKKVKSTLENAPEITIIERYHNK